MFSASEMNQALVKAFNISVCYNNIINTNLKVQNVHQGLRNKDHIVISFDKSMDADQCMKYLDNMKGRIVETFCGNESTASLSFDMKSFPFNFNRSQLVDSNGKYRFSVPIDQSIVFNLKCLLANGLARDITGAMGRDFGLEYVEEYTSDESFDRKSYLYCMRFYDKRLQEYFIESFSATVKGYKNSPKRTDDFLKVKGNCVYIKESLFDKTKFINEIEESQACLIGRDLQTSSSDDPAVEKIKYLITGFIRKACPPLYYVFHTSYSGNNEDSILVPIVSYDNYYRFLTKEEVDTINSSFGMVVLNNIESCTSPKHLPVFGSRGIYGIDFSDPEISHCVITKIIESSVINKDHELSIDPELRLQALSPSSPTPQPTPVLNRHLSSDEKPGKLQEASISKVVSPRQGSGKEKGLLELVQHHLNVAGPSARMSSIVVNPGISGPSSQSLSAAQNVSAWSSAFSRWSSQSTSGNKWQPSPEPGPSGSLLTQSRPPSWKGANPVGANPWVQQTNPCFSQGTSGWKGAAENVPAGTSTRGPGSSPPPLIPSSGSVSGSWPSVAISSSWKGASERRTSDKPLTEEEKELFKALLYAFNLNNHIFECPHTNFIVKNGKIASFINDGVNVKEYLQEVRDKTKEEYCVKEAYNLNEFPFKFLSNCEKNQETTVVANISCGALFNLKKLFIQGQGHKEEVEIEDIDINIVKKAVKSKKDEWVGSQVKKCRVRPREAITTCYPDEDKLEYISIIKDKGGYCLDRTYGTWEVKSLMERWHAKGTLVAGKRSSKAEEKTSDYYSMSEHTDHEESSPMQQQNSSQNTGGGLPKRKSPSPEDGGNPRKSPKRDSLPLSRLESLSLSSSSHQIGKC